MQHHKNFKIINDLNHDSSAEKAYIAKIVSKHLSIDLLVY